MVQWLALCTFTLKGELRSYTLQGLAKNKKKFSPKSHKENIYS